MNPLKAEFDLEQQARTVLRHSERQLDEHTEQQLATARQTALTQTQQKKEAKRISWPALAVATATIAVVAVLFVPSFDNGLAPDSNNQVASVEAEIEQELEFYQWLLETGAIDSSNG